MEIIVGTYAGLVASFALNTVLGPVRASSFVAIVVGLVYYYFPEFTGHHLPF